MLRLIRTHKELRSLSLARCALPPRVGERIADALEKSIERTDALRTLDLSDNAFDAPTGLRLAVVLERSARLVEFNASGNPMDPDAFAAIHRSRQCVLTAWRKTPEGKAEARAAKERGGGGASSVDKMLSALTSFA